MGTPVEELEPLEDPRRGNAGRHSLHDIPGYRLVHHPLWRGKRAPAWPSLNGPKGSSWNPSCRCELESPVMTPSPGCSGFRIRRSSRSGSWDSCASLPKAARGCRPWTARRCAAPMTGRRPSRPCTWSAPGLQSKGWRWGQLAVVFNEDQSRNRKDHCPDNLALLRKLALNLARLEPSKGSIRGKLKRSGWDNDYLVIILSQFTKIQMR